MGEVALNCVDSRVNPTKKQVFGNTVCLRLDSLSVGQSCVACLVLGVRVQVSGVRSQVSCVRCHMKDHKLKSCKRETLKLTMCADCSNDTKNLKKAVTCHLSHVTWHLPCHVFIASMMCIVILTDCAAMIVVKWIFSAFLQSRTKLNSSKSIIDKRLKSENNINLGEGGHITL